MFAFGITINSTPLILGLLGFLAAKASPDLVYLLFGFSTIGGALAIGSSIMIVSMVADIVEDSETTTGRRSEGLFFAGSSFIQKAASGLGLLGSGLVLWAAHFPTDKLPGHIDERNRLEFFDPLSHGRRRDLRHRFLDHQLFPHQPGNA